VSTAKHVMSSTNNSSSTTTDTNNTAEPTARRLAVPDASKED
jgi:hypothetical protein